MHLLARMSLLAVASTMLTGWAPLPLFFLGDDPPFQPGKPVEFTGDAWFPDFRQDGKVIDDGSMTDHFSRDPHLVEGLDGYQLAHNSAIGASYLASGLLVFGTVNKNPWQFLGSAAALAICLELLHVSDGIILAHDVERYNNLLTKHGADRRPVIHWQRPQVAAAVVPRRDESGADNIAATVATGVTW